MRAERAGPFGILPGLIVLLAAVSAALGPTRSAAEEVREPSAACRTFMDGVVTAMGATPATGGVPLPPDRISMAHPLGAGSITCARVFEFYVDKPGPLNPALLAALDRTAALIAGREGAYAAAITRCLDEAAAATPSYPKVARYHAGRGRYFARIGADGLQITCRFVTEKREDIHLTFNLDASPN